MMLPSKTEFKFLKAMELKAEETRLEQLRTKEAMIRKDKENAALCLFKLQVFLASRSA